MLPVPDVGSGDHTLTAGPLCVVSTAAGVLRIGWDEPDWLGPGRLVTPDAIAPSRSSATARGLAVDAGWVVGSARVLADEPVVVLRLQAREPRRGIATGDFATPAV